MTNCFTQLPSCIDVKTLFCGPHIHIPTKTWSRNWSDYFHWFNFFDAITILWRKRYSGQKTERRKKKAMNWEKRRKKPLITFISEIVRCDNCKQCIPAMRNIIFILFFSITNELFTKLSVHGVRCNLKDYFNHHQEVPSWWSPECIIMTYLYYYYFAVLLHW